MEVKTEAGSKALPLFCARHEYSVFLPLIIRDLILENLQYGSCIAQNRSMSGDIFEFVAQMSVSSKRNRLRRVDLQLFIVNNNPPVKRDRL